MRIHLRHSDVWGALRKREMEIIYHSNEGVIARYTIDNAQEPLFVEDVCVLENGYTAVCFIEYGKWYIVDKIFDFQAVPTGFFTKVVTPVEENLTFLSTMDLFVRIWITPQSKYRLFGTKMLAKVSEDGLLFETIEKKAKETVDDLISRIKEGTFPPELVRDFRIEKEL